MIYPAKELEQVTRRLTPVQQETLVLLAQHKGLSIVVKPSIATAVHGGVIHLNALTRNSLRRLELVNADGITSFGALVANYLGVCDES